MIVTGLHLVDVIFDAVPDARDGDIFLVEYPDGIPQGVYDLERMLLQVLE